MRSTGETDRQRAKIKCDAMERIAEEASRADTDRKWFERITEDMMRRLGHSAVAPITVGEWLEQWLAGQRGTVSARTFEKYEQVIRDCSRCFALGLGPLHEVREEDIVRMRDGLVREGRSATTANFAVALLRRAMQVAAERGIIQRNPVALVRSLREQRTVKGVFTIEQLQQLLRVAEEDWYGLILAGWYTGARLGDLSRLQWSNVALELHTISFVQGKTGGTVKIPIHLELEAWLTEQARAKISEKFVFPSFAKQATCTLSQRFSRLVVEAGIVSARSDAAGRGKSVSTLTFHSLRHSFNSELANAGVTQELRQLLTGHSSAQINDKYTHLKMDALREAVSKLPKIS
jgi:integrase